MTGTESHGFTLQKYFVNEPSYVKLIVYYNISDINSSLLVTK
jgi:hypothetical protein